MDYELFAQKVLKTMSTIRQQIEHSKREIRHLLGSGLSEEAVLEYRTLMAYENILSYLEEDFEEKEE